MKRYNILMMAAGFLLLFFIHTSVGNAESSTTYEVGVDSLNVRSAPALDAEVIGSLSKGDRVVVFQKAFGWVQTYYGGQEAWVASQFLMETNKNERSHAKKKITVTDNEVRLRAGPGVEHNIVGYASQGDTFPLVKTENKWHKVVLENGSAAWIAGWLTNSSPKIKKNTTTQGEGALQGYNIVIDPGHGGKDPGAIGIDGVYEKSLIMKTASRTATKLRQAGATVIMTRTSDRFVTLEDRVRISNSYNTDAFISLHYNAYPLFTVNGISTHFYGGNKNRALAKAVQGSLVNNTSLNDRGLMQNGFHVLKNTNAPSILVELGFISNSYDLATIKTAGYHQRVATSIVNGLKNYFQ
ncbi:N-acetylmuramoyl-L-alanine amidase [Virgibacillus kekensis]|uniref:N-acetylmuramoyl-L-alanine amidase n=1 Tax=Virgibacillus kekensis TaxID=202261 RepID=A0ABV9DHZ1_9BACI